MSYRFELEVYIKGFKVKRFIGNDMNELVERFELWFIKTSYDRGDLWIYKGEIQHRGY